MPPNVIVFLSDQQRWDTTGVHGNPLDLTPNFDHMAKTGTHLQQSFTAQPVCGPARACLQTGMYATQTGCYRNDIPLPPEQQTLAHHFAAGGYDTAYIGKWHLGTGIGPVEEAERGGYDYWLSANALEMTSDAYRTRLWDNDNQPHDLPGYRVDALTDALIRHVDDRIVNHTDQPWFVMCSYLEPHHQNHVDDYPPPMGYRQPYAGQWCPPDLAALPAAKDNDIRAGGSPHAHLAGYCGMIKRLDEALGRVVDALHSRSELDNTVILYTSDHACHFKTRNAEYKRSGHEASIRVPTLLHGGPFTGGGRVDQLVSLVDLPATLLDAAGGPVVATALGATRFAAGTGETASLSPDWTTEQGEVLDDGPCRFAMPSTRVRIGADGRLEVSPEGPLSEGDVLARLEIRVLFACTGNTCRSPMAEALARSIATEREPNGVTFRFESAGVAAGEGVPASAGAFEAALERGLDLSDHRSRRVTRRMVELADAVYTMTPSHAQAIMTMLPTAAHKIEPLDPRGLIADPIGQPVEVYAQTLEELEPLIRARLKELEP